MCRRSKKKKQQKENAECRMQRVQPNMGKWFLASIKRPPVSLPRFLSHPRKSFFASSLFVPREKRRERTSRETPGSANAPCEESRSLISRTITIKHTEFRPIPSGTVRKSTKVTAPRASDDKLISFIIPDFGSVHFDRPNTYVGVIRARYYFKFCDCTLGVADINFNVAHMCTLLQYIDG